jgi:hypothetical protein
MSNTKTKRPRIQHQLPIYTETINQRLNKVYKELGIKTEYTNKQVKPFKPALTHDERMEIIRQDMSKIIN